MTRRIALLVNPTSGKGRGARLLAPVADRLRAAGVEVVVIVGRDADEAFDLVRTVVAGDPGVDGVVAVGGDGMVNLALQVVAGTAVPLGIVPAGTGNDFARALGLPRDDPVRPRTSWLAGATPRRRPRSGPTAGGSPASSAPGFDSIVNERANRMRWPHGAQPLQPRDPRRAAGVPAGAVRARRSTASRGETEAMLVAVGNGTSYGGGMKVVPGRPARRRSARRHRARADLASRSSCGSSRRSTRAPTCAHPAVTVRRARRSCADRAGRHGVRRRRARRGPARSRCDAVAAALHVLAGAGARSLATWPPPRSGTPPRAGARRSTTARSARFAALYPFGLDPFQVRACEALEAGHGVLVAAPTGAGKTVVGEFAVHLALAEGRKCFYTTPIKALSNQKYADLVAPLRRRAASACSPATTRVNGEAPVVVMTTEVLRNMLYAGLEHARRARLRRHGRGALPLRPVPRCGLGRGHHPPARVGAAGLAVGDGQQRRGVRRLARDRARRHRRSSSRSTGRCRCGST